MQEIEVQLSDWVFNAIQAHEVLTLHRNYFRLRKPLERRIYEIARKHCGSKKEWKISLSALQDKCGSASTSREFKRLVGNIVAQDEAYNHMPDYSVRLDENMVVFLNRHAEKPQALAAPSGAIRLSPDVYQEARKVAPGWDIYTLEQEWREWMADGGLDAPANPDRAFLGFCRKIFEKRGNP